MTAATLQPGLGPTGTGEDALLDLERAREESGVLRWALLRLSSLLLRRGFVLFVSG